MKKLVLLLLLCPTLLFAATSKIQNCSTIESSGYILSNTIPGAYFYEFELSNLNSGQSLIVTSQGPSASLNLFSSIINYNSSYKVRVRAAISNERDPDFTDWSRYCEFNIEGEQPTGTSISNIECNDTITNLNYNFECSPVYNADCYTFYVVNLSTGQSASSGCLTTNYFALASLGIAFNYNDVITISVSYTMNEIESERSRPCRYYLQLPRPFCHVLQESYDPYLDPISSGSGTRSLGFDVGSRFRLDYDDNTMNSYYASAVWESSSSQIINTAIAVLEDLDAFMDINTVDPSCGNSYQRLLIRLGPYTQYDVDNNQYTYALGYAIQNVQPLDINYLGQNCNQIPNIQLANIYSPYGDFLYFQVGEVRLNPTINNFNLNYPSSPNGNEFDLYSIILHEITHILGINIHDFLYQDHLFSGSTPLNNPGILDCSNSPNYGALSTSTCTNVHFVGNNTNDEIFAPTAPNPSALSHFTDNCFGNNLGNNVMNPGISAGQEKRHYHQREVNALQDLGFNFNNPFDNQSYNLNNTSYIIGNHDGLLVQSFNDEGFMCNGQNYAQINNSICSNWPLNLKPLMNDINATFISEAEVITGNQNATVNIVGPNQDQLNFTAYLPGLYTIAYIPANTQRTGLPTYVQVWVPSCGDADLLNLTCNNSNTCNQICFDNTIYDHTLLRGNMFTEPTGFGTNDYFKFGCTYAQTDQSSVYVPAYSSVFFWINTDLGKEYSISFDRLYYENGSLNNGNPDVKMYAYLVKSADMLNGQVNQSSNNFPALPNDKLLLYEELLTNDNYSFETSSFCFHSDNEYDMIIFYCEQINNFSSHRHGTVGIQNLEFMEKEFPDYQSNVSNCIPADLTLGTPFCAVSSAIYDWTELSSGNSVGTAQIYSAGTINSQLIDQYTITMSYPNLPNTTLFPTENNSCSESHAISVVYDDCCTDGSVPLYHPLTGNSTIGRSFGNDVDSDSNGSLYYSGQTTTNLQFGNLALNQTNGDIGFVMKIKDNCAEWIVPKSRGNIELEVSNNGRVFYSTRYNDYNVDEIGELDPITGATLWNWTVPGNMNYITDFDLNNLTQELIITGQVNSSLLYGGVQIYAGTGTKIFMIKVDFNGILQSTYITPAVSGTNDKYGYVCIDELNSDIFLAYNSSDNDITLRKFDYTNVNTSIPDKILTSSTFSHITSTDINNNSLVIQIAHDQDIYDGGVLLSTATGLTVTALKSLNTNLQTSLFSSNSWGGSFQYMYGITADRPDMHIEGNEVFQTYTDATGDLIVSSTYLNSSILNWSDFSSSQTANTFRGTRGIKSTNLGLFTTGSFVVPLDLNGNIIYPDLTGGPGTYTASFYGIKYDGTGNIAAMSLPDDNDQISSSTNSKAHLDFEYANKDQQKIKIYPNPSKDIFTIDGNGDYLVIVRDLNGKTIHSFNASNQTRIDLSDQAPGIYQVSIRSDSKNETFKIIKMD